MCSRIFCKEPAGVQLRPQVPQPENLPPCPVTADSDSPIPAHNYHKLNINVLVTDDQGREFDNVSSLYFDWKLSDASLGSIDDSVPVKSAIRQQLGTSAAEIVCEYILFTRYHSVNSRLPSIVCYLSLDIFYCQHKDVAVRWTDLLPTTNMCAERVLPPLK